MQKFIHSRKFVIFCFDSNTEKIQNSYFFKSLNLDVWLTKSYNIRKVGQIWEKTRSDFPRSPLPVQIRTRKQDLACLSIKQKKWTHCYYYTNIGKEKISVIRQHFWHLEYLRLWMLQVTRYFLNNIIVLKQTWIPFNYFCKAWNVVFILFK